MCTSNTVHHHSRKAQIGKKRTPLQPRIVQETLTTVNKELASELEQVELECTKKDQQLRDVTTKLSEYNPHNVRRWLQRKDTKIVCQKEQY